MAKSCGGCKFWRPIAAGGVYACHFLLDTGIPRCYPPEECIYHTKGMENMSRGKALSPETIGQIEQMNAEGKSISQICDALSVSSATVTRVRNGKLKSPEAPTPMENASEDITVDNIDTNILADIVENVKQAGACENNCIPDIVKEVVSHALDNLANEIHILAGRLEELKADRAQLEKWYFENCNEEVKHGTR